MVNEIRTFLNSEVEIGTKSSYTDYICDYQLLKNYEGHDYKRKRKSARFFYRKYDYEYKSLSTDNINFAIKELNRILFDAKQEVDADEWRAYVKILKNMKILNLRGGMIIIEGKMEAVSVAEKFYDTVIIHIRRCNKRYNGIYPAMLQLLLKNEFIDFDYKYVNLQDDMGMENLRKMKLSYKPIILLNKYYICERGDEHSISSY